MSSGGDEAAFDDLHLLDVLQLGCDAVDLPGVGVQVVLHRYLLPHDGRYVDDAGHGLLDALDVVHLKADLHAGFRAAGLLAGAPREDADHVGAELREDGLECASEAGPVGQQENDGGDAPCHSEDGDGRTPAVVPHCFQCLAKDVLEHRYSFRSASTGCSEAALLAG